MKGKFRAGSVVKWLAVATCVIVLPLLMPNTYLIRILDMVGIYILLSTGSNILTGYAGQLSMGQAGFYGLGAYTAGLMSMYLGSNLWLTLPCAIAVACVFGLILAIPALRLKGGYLTLLTIGFGEIFRLVMNNWVSFTRGPSGITGITEASVFGFTLSSHIRWYYFIFAIAALGLIYQSIVMKSRVGRAFIAIREDDQAAELTGIDITRYKVMAFITSAVYCAIAGVLYAHMTGYISPDSFTSNESNFILWSAIVGGLGTQLGPILGGFIMVVFPEALRALGAMRLVIFGVILMLVIIYYPKGLVPFLQQMYGRIRARFQKGKTPAGTNKDGGV